MQNDDEASPSIRPAGCGQLVKTLIRGVFQKYAECFHRMFASAARLLIFHVKHAWYMFIKYR